MNANVKRRCDKEMSAVNGPHQLNKDSFIRDNVPAMHTNNKIFLNSFL